MKMIRVLLVDDHIVVREGFASILSFQPDIEVVGQAKDGLEAIEIARQQKPDVILLDLEMPRLNGFDAISQLREVAPGVKILILTGYQNAERVYRAIKAGAIGYLIKDSTWQQLVEAIHNVADGQPYIESSIALKLIQESNPAPTAAPANPAFTLTQRESQVLAWIAKGLSNQEIAGKLVVQESTVAKYVGNILAKLQLDSRTQAAVFAIHEGLDNNEDNPAH